MLVTLSYHTTEIYVPAFGACPMQNMCHMPKFLNVTVWYIIQK